MILLCTLLCALQHAISNRLPPHTAANTNTQTWEENNHYQANKLQQNQLTKTQYHKQTHTYIPAIKPPLVFKSTPVNSTSKPSQIDENDLQKHHKNTHIFSAMRFYFPWRDDPIRAPPHRARSVEIREFESARLGLVGLNAELRHSAVPGRAR